MLRIDESDPFITLRLEGEGVKLRTYRSILDDLARILADIERTLLHQEKATVSWRWADDDAALQIIATPNGASRETLQSIVSTASSAFRSVAESEGSPISWPDGFGPTAQRAIQGIARKLSQVDRMVVETPDADSVELTSATLHVEVQSRRTTYLEYSSLEGKLDLISVRKSPQFSIGVRGGRIVRCSFRSNDMEKVKKALGRDVVAEGWVRFRMDGTPFSIRDAMIQELGEESRTLDQLAGSAPRLGGKRSAESYVRFLRSGE